MHLNREQKLVYGIFGLLIAAGAIWTGYNLLFPENHTIACLFRTVSGVKCPSCGTTTSVLQLLNGNPVEAWYANPLGFPAAILMLLVPGWILHDMVEQKPTFYSFYHKAETWLRKYKVISGILIISVLLNWLFIISDQ